MRGLNPGDIVLAGDGAASVIDTVTGDILSLVKAAPMGTDLDCDGSEVLDECEISAGLVEDMNQNQVPDVCEERAIRFRRGDANADGAVDLSDVMATFGHLFLGSVAPACPDAADADDSGVLDLSDGVYTLGYLFLGTTAPPLPGPDACGPDVAADELGACLYAACP